MINGQFEFERGPEYTKLSERAAASWLLNQVSEVNVCISYSPNLLMFGAGVLHP